MPAKIGFIADCRLNLSESINMVIFMIERLGSLFQYLDMSTDNGLAFEDDQSLTVYQKQFFDQAKKKIHTNAIYFLRDAEGVPKIPIVYFSCLLEYDEESIAQLHRLAWNMGEAPLLFIVLPHQILIYDNYEAPQIKNGRIDPLSGFIEKISLVETLETQRRLQPYRRIQLETGEFWRVNTTRFNINSRVDVTLISNLRIMRAKMISKIVANNHSSSSLPEIGAIVHGLLGRSILVKYLEERKDTQGNSVFPNDFFSKFHQGAKSYGDLLCDIKATYALYAELEKHFHGDIFPIMQNEQEIVTQLDLLELKSFLDGDIDFHNNQMTLWPLYSFDVIPIQLISSVYEMFFHYQENESEKGTYYTPFHLVDLLMDEVLPWEAKYREIKILDPSCGSGIFLVEAYRRIIGQWQYSHPLEKITSSTLISLLSSSIFGVDLNREAIRIASFSLCLTMCDFLEPRTIWEELEFPQLNGNNLFPCDFFKDGECFDQYEYDVIIGNPPWESQLTDFAVEYIRSANHPVGDKQVAQAFSWKALDLCADTGIICFLMPSKGLLFNRSTTNIAYRKAFFEETNVIVLLNLSVFRKVLFSNATGPATGVVYRKKNNDGQDNPVFYCTPKPLYTVEDRRRFFIEPADICRIPRDIVNNDLIWKISMWGSPRDLELISKLRTQNITIDELTTSLNMSKAEGLKRGNKKKSCPDLLITPFVPVKKIIPFRIDSKKLIALKDDGFECTVEKSRQVFLAPHLLIKQSPVQWRFFAAYLDFDATFNHSILGIHGRQDVLKYLCLIVNSKLFSYYHIMTSRRWLVERDELEAGEILSTPVPAPTEAILQQAISIYDQEVIDEVALETFIFDIYHLKDYERLMINDAILYLYDSFHLKSNSRAFTRPAKEHMDMYATTISGILSRSLYLSQKTHCVTYHGVAPLAVARIYFNEPKFENHEDNSDDASRIDELLQRLDKLLIEQRSQSVFVKRNVRIYLKDEVYVIKPNQSKYWSYSAACRDADEIYADIMRAWRLQHEQY